MQKQMAVSTGMKSSLSCLLVKRTLYKKTKKKIKNLEIECGVNQKFFHQQNRMNMNGINNPSETALKLYFNNYDVSRCLKKTEVFTVTRKTTKE
ncbi:hypothetical protein E2I00_009453 [Balaenoptera physalus]|uniref:Uncharacterized protein n=1 Tax=Balaenoptera physalus TaxID=9770 RepID=A0A643BZQ5_BALPH|nr:hypothetical protein E2I00_009453 [Balaenoptera physalus]